MNYNGPKVRKLRREAGLSSAELSEGICTNLMLFQIEENRANPSDELMSKIAEKLEVTVDDLK